MGDGTSAIYGDEYDRDRAFDVAVSLMRMALALLDRVDEPLAAARLQHAINTAERRGTGQRMLNDPRRFLDLKGC